MVAALQGAPSNPSGRACLRHAQTVRSPMSSLVSSPLARRSTSGPGSPPRQLSRTVSHRSERTATGSLLAGYVDTDGRARELLALPGHGGSILLLDRDAATLCDRRLVAHLAADEPPDNAAVVCRHYLDDSNGRWCRRVRPEDLQVAPFASLERRARDNLDPPQAPLEDRHGHVYRLAPPLGESSTSTTKLRWYSGTSDSEDVHWEQVKLRDVVAALESYEPVRTLTEQAL